MNNKKDFFSTVFCIFIAVLFILGCKNHLLKPHQDEAHLIVKIANSTGARNVSSETEYNVTAWIENRDGSQSHYQEISTKENHLILTFEDLVIGSQINIHLELTKNDDSQTKLTGESGWFPVKEGEQVIEIPLESQTNTDDSGEGNGSTSDGETEGDEPAIVDAEPPVITQQPHGKSQTFEPNTATSVTADLAVVATVDDGGTLTYQWYSNTSNSTSGGTLINGATDPSYTASTGAKSTTYYYCVITNTNNDVNGKTTVSVTSHIAAISSIEGELTSITAQYIGTGYQLVNTELNYDDIEIEQTYTAGSEIQVVTVSAEEVKDQYTIDLPENTIGMVPATVIHTETKKETTVDIPVKYELKEAYVSVTGAIIAQYTGNHTLSASYNDPSVSLELYQNSSPLTDYVNYTWNPSSVDNTQTKSYTLTVSSKNDWCILPSEGITKEVTVSVTPWTLEINADSPENLTGGQGYTLTATNTSGTATGITYESNNTSFSISGSNLTAPAATTSAQSTTIAAKYNGQTLATLVVKVPAEVAPSGISTQEQLVQAIADASAGDTITINNTITITETLVIDKKISIKGSGDISLQRANTGTITGPMIEVKMGCELDLSDITLDGQWNNSFTDGKNNPLIYVNSGILRLTFVDLKNNYMKYPGTAYKDKNEQSTKLYSAAAIYALDSSVQIMDCNFTDFFANSSEGGVINIEATISGAYIDISGSTVEACTGTTTNALQLGSDDTVFNLITNSINGKSLTVGFRSIKVNITPDSP